MKTLIQLAGSGSSSTPIVYVTKAQLDTLIAGSTLVPGQYYGITNADIPLYGGTEVVIQAIKNNELALEGEGVFYTPKYSTATGFGIWYSGGIYAAGNKAIWGGKRWTNLSGNAGTAIDNYTLSPADWSPIAYNTTDYNISVDIIHYDYFNDRIIYRKDKLDNEVSLSNQVILYYEINYGRQPMKDFQWGNPRQITDNGTYENKVTDSLFDCLNFRGDVNTGNIVSGRSRIMDNVFERCYFIGNTLDQDSVIINNTFGIVGSFGCNVKYNKLSGKAEIKFNTLNPGTSLNNNTLDQSGAIMTNSLIASLIEGNIVIGYSTGLFGNVASKIANNVLDTNCIISSNVLNTGGQITNNQLDTNCKIYNNNLSIGIIDGNIMDTASDIYWNTIYEGGSISYNTLSVNSGISLNKVNQQGAIGNCQLTSGGIGSCTISSSSSIQSCVLTSNSSIVNCTLDNQSQLYFFQLDSSSQIGFSSFINTSVFDMSLTPVLLGKFITNLTADGATYVTDDISTATDIYGFYSKTIFNNAIGFPRLMYYDAADNQIIVNVNN